MTLKYIITKSVSVFGVTISKLPITRGELHVTEGKQAIDLKNGLTLELELQGAEQKAKGKV